MRSVAHKTQDAVTAEWDRIAEIRSDQIRMGRDLSYQHVLSPMILESVFTLDRSSVLDVGCGCGFLTERLAATSGTVVGIDPSRRSIELARRHCQEIRNVAFVNATIESFATSCGDRQFTVAIANMSLIAMLDLPAALKAIASTLVDGGNLVLSITHPWFWSRYWQYSDEWFSYSHETVIEAPFKISLDREHSLVTTHVHRPLNLYFRCITEAGFVVRDVKEPMPPPQIESLYPEKWEYPRFLGAVCERRVVR